MPPVSYLRSICVIPVTAGADIHDPALWERVFAGWRHLPVRDEVGALTPQAQAITDLVISQDRAEVRAGALVLTSWPQSDHDLPALVSTLDGGRFVVLRVFGVYLTEVQDKTARLIERLLKEEVFAFQSGSRVNLAVSVEGVRANLTSGRIRAGHGGAWSDFYQNNKYAVTAILVVFVVALSAVLLITPNRPYTPIDKLYDLSGRVLSAVLFNIILLGSQFLFFLRHRDVIEWEKP